MSIQLSIDTGDDVRFISCLERLLKYWMDCVRPTHVYVSRLDHWFGDRWFGFKGKYLGAMGIHVGRDRERLTMPPFVPNRVLVECCYERNAEGGYQRQENPPRIALHQPSGANLQRFVGRFCESGILFWYSGDTSDQERGSAMMYLNTPDVSDAWYLCLRKQDDLWRFEKGVGLTKSDFEGYLNPETP